MVDKNEANRNVLILSLGKKYGGAEQYTISLFEGLKEMGSRAYLVVRKDGGLTKRIEDPGALRLEVSILSMIRDVRKLREYILDNDIQVLHCNGINAMVYALFVPNIRKIAVIHGDTKADHVGMGIIKERIFPWLEIGIINKFDKCVAVSESLKELLVSRGANSNKVTTIYNGIDFIEYDSYAVKKKDMLRMCSVGNLLPIKNHKVILEALNHIKNNYTSNMDICLDIYGVGECEDELRDYIKEHNLTNVNIMGFDSNIRNKLNYYNVLVHPSLYESFGIAIIEAINAGCYIIGSDVGGIREIHDIIPDRFSLFDASNYIELSSLILRITNDEINIEKKREQAVTKLKRLFSKNEMAKRTMQLYG